MQSFKQEPLQQEISRVVLSGSNEKASIFLSAGQSIRGITKKGKDFFKLDTSHTETIRHLHVAGSNLWSAGSNTLNCYESKDNRIIDKYFFNCEETINEMIVTTLPSNLGSFNAVLACNDSTIKVLSGVGKFQYLQRMDSPVTTISLTGSNSMNNCPYLAYGLKNGSFGILELDSQEAVFILE